MRTAQLTAIGVLLLASCFCGLTRGLWTPDEPREAGISREMLEHPGVIPTLNGQPFIEKPPLYYWLTAAAFRIAGGPNAAAARAVSGLAGLLTLVVVFAWIARAKTTVTAAMATVLLASSAAFITSVHWIRIDEVLLLFCAVAIWAAWERIGRGSGAGFLVLFYGALVLALWTKGLIGPVLVAAGLAGYAVLRRSLAVWRPLKPVAGVAILAAAVGLLAAAIGASGGYAAVREWFYVNHVERFVHPVSTGHDAPLGYYLWTLPAAIAPWLVPLLTLFWIRGPLWRSTRADAALVRFALAFTAVPLLVLSAASSKRQVYLLPLLPPLALLMALAVQDRIGATTESGRSRGWGRLGDWLQATLLALAALAPPVASVVTSRRVTPTAGLFLVLGIAAVAWLASALVKRDLSRAFWTGAGCMGIAVFGATVLLVPRVDEMKDLQPFIRAVDAMLPSGEPVRALGADETLLGIVPFVTGRPVIPVQPNALEDAPFVLVQTSGAAADPLASDASFERAATRQFGPNRRMTLWRKRD